MLTLVEYLLLLYRALLPAPVWYRFFLNKEYGSLFSSLMTGLYLTFKLTSVVEKVRTYVSTKSFLVMINIIGSVVEFCRFYLEPHFFILKQNPYFQALLNLLMLSGPIIHYCSESIVKERHPLWSLCYIRAGLFFFYFCTSDSIL